MNPNGGRFGIGMYTPRIPNRISLRKARIKARRLRRCVTCRKRPWDFEGGKETCVECSAAKASRDRRAA